MRRTCASLVAVMVVFFVGLPGAFSEELFSRITGTVLVAHGHPVAGVKISVKDAGGKVIRQTITNRKGQYALEKLPLGQVHLTLDARKAGYRGETVVASLKKDGLTVIWTLSANRKAMATALAGTTAQSGGVTTLDWILSSVLTAAFVSPAIVAAAGGFDNDSKVTSPSM
ncbi:MAG: carboxypeptidase-like regulatory domain-containing protein [Candidatus Binatia bacterium]